MCPRPALAGPSAPAVHSSDVTGSLGLGTASVGTWHVELPRADVICQGEDSTDATKLLQGPRMAGNVYMPPGAFPATPGMHAHTHIHAP